MAHHAQGLVVQEVYGVALLAQKLLSIVFAKDRPVMLADQIFCAVKFQRPRHVVGPLDRVAGKSTSDVIDSVQAYIAIIGCNAAACAGGNSNACRLGPHRGQTSTQS